MSRLTYYSVLAITGIVVCAVCYWRFQQIVPA